MSATSFSLDDITLEYSQEDYKPQRQEPKCGLWYEFNIKEAKVEQATHGHLQAKVTCEALDASGKVMFKKWVNIPMPISIGEIAAPTYAKGLWLKNVVAFYPEANAYNRIAKDPITGKMQYFDGDTKLEGKSYDEAMTSQNGKIGEKAREIAKGWVSEPDSQIEEWLGKRFFAKLIASKDGQYTNIDRPYAVAPSGEDVCYDKKEAMKQG